MKLNFCILLCHIGWLSATLMIYHERSMKEFGGKITTNKTSFGYSVTYTPDNKKLIVSAPKASEHGALFSCDITGTDCASIPVSEDIHITVPKDYHIWLGATVRAGSNFFMVSNFDNSYLIEVTATPSRCYKYFNSGKYKTRLRRLPQLPESYFASRFEHKMLTFGWSMDIDENDNAVIGGPAMFSGYAVKYDSSKTILNKPPVLITPGNRSAPFLKSNFGYSVVHRKYNSEMQVAVSSTYGKHGYGMVVLYNDTDGAIIGKIRGTQVGAMFGASLCAASVDSKGQALLLVGAPTHTSENKYNIGAVFVYKDEGLIVFNKIKGVGEGGQFGLALANLGDLNGDNKDEIAISAPYEDEGQGAVYIYSGAQIMDQDKEVRWLQKIQRTEYRSFGLSLYAILDYDGNGCKELAIGVPQNDRTVLFSCFATITVIVKQLNPKGKISDKDGLSSFMFESCLTFQYPVLPEAITANFSVGLAIPNVLIKLLATEESSNGSISYNIHVTADKIPEYCKDLIISVPTDKTYDPTLRYQISADLLGDPKTTSTFDPTRVTVSDLSTLAIQGTTWIGDCANGDKCIPKLEMNVILSVTNSPYVVGSTTEETVSISVQNTGDPAYQACIQVFLHGVNLLSWPPSCMLTSEVNSRDTLTCSPVKLLKNNTSWDIQEIILDMKTIKSKADGGGDNFDVHVHLFKECGTGRAMKIMKTPTPVHWDSENVTVMGIIRQGGVINITRNEIEKTSKQIQHEYKIVNNGPTTWRDVRVNISLEKEFYLDGISPTSGRFYDCTSSEETNKEYINNCVIHELKKNTTFDIVQPIDVTSKIYETLKKKQLKVISHLKLTLDGEEKIDRVVTTLRYYEIGVPTWIIVVAVLFGLLIFVIMVFILYQRGFLRRKKKDDLTRLKRNVKRQSMRRTTMMHDVDVSDKEKLTEIAEEAKPDDEAASTSATVEVNEEDIHTQKDNKNEVPANDCDKFK